MKVLVIGHACSPYAGSEPGLTWNWAWHLSAEHEVWLIAHPHFREPVERYLADHPNDRFHVEWVALPRALDPWRPERGERGLRLHYTLWLHAAHRAARRLVEGQGIDLVHHVSLGTVGAPPPFWRLPVPFFWGPLGGGQVTPPAFRAYFDRGWTAERLRALRLALVERAPSMRRCARHAACVFATNHETEAMLRRAGAADVRILADNGIDPRRLGERQPPRPPDGVFRLLWAGRLEPRKGLPLLLEAMARLGRLPVHLTVAGDGPEAGACRALAGRLCLGDRVTFLGRVPPERMAELFAGSDAFAFTSLRDSLGSVTLEALAKGLPLITLDHQGQRAIVPPDAAVKVPADSPAAAVEGLAGAVRALASDPDLRDRLALAGHAFAGTLLWSRRARAMSLIYTEKLVTRRTGAASVGALPDRLPSNG